MNVVHCTNKDTTGLISNDFEQSEGEASFVLSLSDLLKTFHSSFCRSSKQSEFSPKRIVEKVFNKRMDGQHCTVVLYVCTWGSEIRSSFWTCKI